MSQYKMPAALSRINRDLQDIKLDDFNYTIVYAKQRVDNPLVVEALLEGTTSKYYYIEIYFSTDYPYEAPIAMYVIGPNYPDGFETGRYMAEFFRNNWPPVYTIKSILYDTLSLLPNGYS